jgi:putative spermidine/putrescine transport system permease protein
MSRRTSARVTLALLLLPGIGYLMLFFGLPLLRVIAGSLELSAENWTPNFQHYRTIVQTPIFVDGLWFSVWLAIAPTLFSVVIGVPIAALLVTKFPGKNFFGAMYKIPLVVPTIVAAFIVLVLVDRGGMAHRWLGVFGITLPRMVRDPAGIGIIIIASAWKNIPFMALIVAGSMAAIPEDLKRAGRTLGASTLTIFFRIQLPLALPGITAASLLIFIASLGAFAIPNILGPASPLPLSVHMYEQGFRYSRWPLVYAMGTLLSLTAIVVLLLYYRLTRRVHQSLAAGRA